MFRVGNTKSDNLTKWRNAKETEMPLHLAVATTFRVHGFVTTEVNKVL